MKKVTIIGAGTIGLHCAYYLIKSGCQVEVIEARPENDESGCSYGNCGFIVPSHFIPMASPDMLKSGIKMILDRKSPLYLPMGKNLTDIPWFLKFMFAANTKRVKKVIPTLYNLNEESRKLYAELDSYSGHKSEYKHRGLLMAASSEKGLLEEIEIARIASSFGIVTEVLDPNQLKKMEPDVAHNLQGAVHYIGDAQINPVLHMKWLKSYLKMRGVQFHYDSKVVEVVKTKNKIKRLITNNGLSSADEFVLAAGTGSRLLAKKLDISLPVISGKGYSIDFDKSELNLKTPLILTEAKIAISPFRDKVRISSGMEFNGRVGEIRLKRVQEMLDNTHLTFPSYKEKDASNYPIWEGLRPLSPDGIPFVGRTNKIDNLLFATGHAMMGVSLAPVTGKIICDIIKGKDSSFDLELLHPDRFKF